MVQKFNDADIFRDADQMTAGLEGAIQNLEVGDRIIIQALVHEFFPSVFQVGLFGFGDANLAHEAAENAIVEAVSNRDKYWGDTSVRAWVLRNALFAIQKLQTNRRTVHPPKWLASRELKSLDLVQAQLVLLRFGLRFDACEIGYIEKQKPEEISEQISGILLNLLVLADSDDLSHEEFRRMILDEASGMELGNNEIRLRDHLEGCADCRDFSHRVDHLTRGLGIAAQSIWPSGSFTEGELDQIDGHVGVLFQQRKTRKRFTLRSKEVLLVGLVITAVLLLGWAFRVMSTDDGFSQSTDPTTVAGSTSNEGLTYTGEDKIYSVKPLEAGAALRSDDGNYSDIDTGILLRYLPLDRFHEQENWVDDSGSTVLEIVLSYWSDIKSNPLSVQTCDCGNPTQVNDIIDYIHQYTNLRVLYRFGGDTSLLRDLTKAGFPVIIQMGDFTGEYEGWIGHYDIVAGFQDGVEWAALASRERKGLFIPLLSTFMENRRMAFNYSYMVIYPQDREEMVRQVVGDQFDLDKNLQHANAMVQLDEYHAQSDLDRFFAWYNRGTLLTYQEAYYSASDSFDRAFAFFDKIPEPIRPWRILWYGNQVYNAYYHAGRYQDVIDLATQTLQSAPESYQKESSAWRAMALEKPGDSKGAFTDLSNSVELLPSYLPEKIRLQRMFGRDH